MIFSKQKLLQEAFITGFRAEILEKVFLLMNLLSEFQEYPQLKMASLRGFEPLLPP